MTLNEFLVENKATAFEYIDDVVMNVVVDEAIYGLDVDTSNIEAGRLLTRTTNFQLNNDILIVDELELNTLEVDLL